LAAVPANRKALAAALNHKNKKGLRQLRNPFLLMAGGKGLDLRTADQEIELLDQHPTAAFSSACAVEHHAAPAQR
jgi:hypothetical protein